MIRVVATKKQSNRINQYACTDGKKTLVLNKKQIINCINAGMVENATLQVYKGCEIVRLSGEVRSM